MDVIERQSNPRRAVVTGSAGFIGRNLAGALMARGYSVTGIDRRPGTPEGVRAVDADVAGSSPQVLAALEEADAVWHLAACPGVRAWGAGIARRRNRDNIEAGRVVLDGTPSDTPVVVTSSSSVYGGSLHGGALRASRETDELRPLGGYASSKVALERLCSSRRSRGGWIAVARPFTVAGEGQRGDMAISMWRDAALRGERLKILGTPDRMRDVTDVRDVVEGLIRLVERDVQETVNLGSGVARRIDDIARMVCEEVGVPFRPEIAPASSEEVVATLADVHRASDLLGIEPNTDLRAVIARQIEAARSVPLPVQREVV